MEFNIDINFKQLLSIVKQMPEEQRIILKEILYKEDEFKFPKTLSSDSNGVE